MNRCPVSTDELKHNRWDAPTQGEPEVDHEAIEDEKELKCAMFEDTFLCQMSNHFSKHSKPQTGEALVLLKNLMIIMENDFIRDEEEVLIEFKLALDAMRDKVEI